jgi:phosphomannomutase
MKEMLNIKFGTDGWRAIIGDEYTVENVARVSKAVCIWLQKTHADPVVVIGHDCRFGGELFTETAIKVLCSNGVKVLTHKGFVSTPMISFAVLQYKAQQGIVITASHNPPSYNGFKLKAPHGGPTPPAQILEVEALIPNEVVPVNGNLINFEKDGLLEYVDLEQAYIDYIYTKFDIDKLNKSRFKLVYDAMFGAGQNVIQRLFPKAVLLHCERNPLFNNTPPEPLHKNLLALSETIAQNAELQFGLANDGDADRIALYDEDGTYIDSHHIILILVHYLHKYKKLDGKVAIAASTSLRVEKMCKLYNIPCEVTPIGFKYISEIMMHENVMVGGEESGGISVAGHIPERDGIYDGLVVYEFMEESGKSLKEICQEVYEVVGSFFYHRDDLTLTEELKNKAVEKCKAGIKAFGEIPVLAEISIDGYKYILPNDCWAMVRASGTEPVLRIYTEGNDKAECMALQEAVKATLFA